MDRGIEIVDELGADRWLRGHDLESGLRCHVSCLRKCAYRDAGERFCIAQALDRAQRGDVRRGLVFCGSNAWRSERIATVQEIFDELFVLTESRAAVNA